MTAPAAIIFALAAAGVILFQLGLALGAPWGACAMAGRYPGRFPPRIRVAALVQGLILAGLVLSRVARRLWVRAAPVMLLTSLVVAGT